MPLKARVIHLLDRNRLGCAYHPLIDLDTNDVVAYEALARFNVDGEDVAPNLVFGALRDDRTLLFTLESRLKALQLANRPSDLPLFMNLDPHGFLESYQIQHWIDVFQTDSGIVLEIVENHSADNLASVQSFLNDMERIGVRCALDDVGGPRSLFSFDLLDSCQFIKFDRRWFWRLEADACYEVLLQGLVNFAAAKDIATVIEGVQSLRHMEVARQLGIKWAQGPLFSDREVEARSLDA